MLWFVVAILLGGAPVDVMQVRMVDGPFMSLQSCAEVATEVVVQINTGMVPEYVVNKGQKYRVTCLPVKPDHRIVI